MAISEQQRPTLDRPTFREILKGYSFEDAAILDHAYQMTKAGHRDKWRIGGARYFEHPREVVNILYFECGIKDPAVLAAGFLHDMAEDTSVFGNPTEMTNSEFERQVKFLISRDFYPQTADIVWDVTEPSVDGVEVLTEHDAKTIKYDKLRFTLPGGLIVKMADRLHNLRTFFPKVGEETPEKRIRETEEILIPIFEQIESTEYKDAGKYLISEIRKAIAILRSQTYPSELTL